MHFSGGIKIIFQLSAIIVMQGPSKSEEIQRENKRAIGPAQQISFTSIDFEDRGNILMANT